jgi:hypothetical protein
MKLLPICSLYSLVAFFSVIGSSSYSSEMYRGEYVLGLETGEFDIDGRPQDRIWVDYNKNVRVLNDLLKKKSRIGFGSLDVLVCGELSPKGRYGHMDMFTHRMTITKVLAVGADVEHSGVKTREACTNF